MAAVAMSCGGTPESGRSSPDPGVAATPAPGQAPAQATPAPADDEVLAGRYVAIRERLEAEPGPSGKELGALKAELLEIANGARDLHLRANASLLLGSILEASGDRLGAIGHYRHAAKLVPDDAGPVMALATGLAASGDLVGALQAQQSATDLDPDNLENWLALGELATRTGDDTRATAAYVDYERRRKGLIDGLTLKNKAGDYLVSEDERIGCAEALAAAADSGSAVALLYALGTDTSARVRAAVARVMGIQRLSGFAGPLQARLESETDPDARDAIAWALGEIVRDPVKVEPGPRAALDVEDPRAARPGAEAPQDRQVPPAGEPAPER